MLIHDGHSHCVCIKQSYVNLHSLVLKIRGKGPVGWLLSYCVYSLPKGRLTQNDIDCYFVDSECHRITWAHT